MKVAIVGDCHFGVRKASDVFADHQVKFIEETLFPYLIKHGIKNVIQLGDLVEERPIIHSKTVKLIREKWFDPFERNKITLHQMVGNHDSTYKNTNSLNWIDLLLSSANYRYVEYYEDAQTIDVDGTAIDIIPWITSDNHDEIMAFMGASDSPYLMAHLELSGFEMAKGHIIKNGMSVKPFKDYTKVFTGHYHISSEKGNILYTGTPYELDWGDVDSPKGFWVFDTETGIYEFVPNPDKLFIEFDYDDEFNVADHDFDQYEGKFVKVQIKEREDVVNFDSFLTRLRGVDVINSTTKDATNKEVADIDVDDFEPEDTESLLNKYVDVNTPEILDKERIHAHMREAYQDAKTIMKNTA